MFDLSESKFRSCFRTCPSHSPPTVVGTNPSSQELWPQTLDSLSYPVPLQILVGGSRFPDSPHFLPPGGATLKNTSHIMPLLCSKPSHSPLGLEASDIALASSPPA